MLENEWLYDRAYENGMKEGIKRGKALAYKKAITTVRDEIPLTNIPSKIQFGLDVAYENLNKMADNCNQKTTIDPIPHEELTSSRLFHHIRANQLEKLLNRFLEDKDSDPDFPLFDFDEAEKERQFVLSFLERKDSPKATQIYLYASLDAIDFYVRKAHEYMQRVLSVSTTDKNPVFADMDIDIFFQEITLEIQIARTASLRIKNDYPNF